MTRSSQVRSIAVVMLLAVRFGTAAGVVGGPQSRHEYFSPGTNKVFKFQFEHRQNAEIKVSFDIHGADAAVCKDLKMKVWVGQEWFFTGSGRYEMTKDTAYCIVQSGYGSAHKYANDRREVTVQVLNDLSSGGFSFDLTTN